MKNRTALQKPRLLQAMALLFLLAPLGNILISFYGTGRPDWAEGPVFWRWLSTVNLLDWLWLGSTFITGILLLIQHKTAWFLAIINLGLILVVNIYRWTTTGELIDVEYSYFWQQNLFSLLGTLLGLGIIFYAKYPYLDRRTKWLNWGAPRFEISTAATLMGQDVYYGKTQNISMTGCLLELNKALGPSSKMRYVDLVLPEIKNLKLKCQIVHHEGALVRVKFRELKGENRQTLQKWLQNKI